MSVSTRIFVSATVLLALISWWVGEWSAFVMGAFQGVTEFLPISSSAHLIVIPWLFDWQDPLLHSLVFDVGLHLGTLVAIVIYFWRDWLGLLGGIPHLLRPQTSLPARQLWAVMIGTVPAAILGILFQDEIEAYLRSPVQIAIVLAVMGLVIAYADRIGSDQRDLRDMSWREAIWIGLAQACALVPGVSRSGATMSAARVLGFDRTSAARFSFLLSTPITLAAVMFSLNDLLAIQGDQVLTLLVGVVTSAVVGWLVIDLLLAWIRRIGLGWFAYYRWVIAIVILVTWWMRTS
jgi:undecaprenyl-diphosphatase